MADPEAQKELFEFSQHKAFEVIEIDHMYCNSLKKEFLDDLLKDSVVSNKEEVLERLNHANTLSIAEK